MKKAITLTILLTMLVTAMGISSFAAYSANDMAEYGQETLSVYKAAVAPVQDGVVNSGEYNQAIRVLNQGDSAVYYNGDDSLLTAAELSDILPKDFTIYAAYDDNYLYLASTNIDKSHCVPLTGTGVWDGDYLEIDIATNVDADWANMTNKLRLAMGLSSADDSICIYAAGVQSDAKEQYEQNTHIDGIGTVTYDKATGLTTYEAKIPWANLTADGKVPANAFFYYQLGIADEDFLDISEYESYLGVFRYATLQSDEMKAETNTGVIANIMTFAGDVPVVETQAVEETPATETPATATPVAAQTSDSGSIAFAAIAALSVFGLTTIKKKSK